MIKKVPLIPMNILLKRVFRTKKNQIIKILVNNNYKKLRCIDILKFDH